MRTAILFGLVFIGNNIGTLSANTRIETTISFWFVATFCILLDTIEALDNHYKAGRL